MNFEWSGRATCRNCGINYSNVEPELIIKTDDGREFIICPSCLKLAQVTNSGDDMVKDPARIKHYHINSTKVLEEISKSGEEGERRATYIKHSIRVNRAKMGLDPVSF